MNGSGETDRTQGDGWVRGETGILLVRETFLRLAGLLPGLDTRLFPFLVFFQVQPRC